MLCDQGVASENATLRRLINMSNLESSVHLLGPRRDISQITAALDVGTSCSKTESFSLILAEAMACGVFPVSSDLPGRKL